MTDEEALRLRAMEPEDLDLLYSIENDTMLWDVGTTNVPYSRYVLHDYIATASGDIYADRQVRLVIENGVGETVGLADVTGFDAKNCRAEVGIVIARQLRRRGYGLQALGRLSDYARRVLHLHQLYAIVSADNRHTLDMFRKAGYNDGATLRQWLFDGKKYHDAVLMQIFF